jgi:hypothetical protein
MRTAIRWLDALAICIAAGAAMVGAIGIVAISILCLIGADGATWSAVGWCSIVLGSGLLGLWAADQVEARL